LKQEQRTLLRTDAFQVLSRVFDPLKHWLLWLQIGYTLLELHSVQLQAKILHHFKDFDNDDNNDNNNNNNNKEKF